VLAGPPFVSGSQLPQAVETGNPQTGLRFHSPIGATCYPGPAIAGIQQVARGIGVTRKDLSVTGALLVS
jgi:hypothetical protein